MSTNRKATFAKRQRELDQKDRVKEREARRAVRRTRGHQSAGEGEGEGVGVKQQGSEPGASIDAVAAEVADTTAVGGSLEEWRRRE